MLLEYKSPKQFIFVIIPSVFSRNYSFFEVSFVNSTNLLIGVPLRNINNLPTKLLVVCPASNFQDNVFKLITEVVTFLLVFSLCWHCRGVFPLVLLMILDECSHPFHNGFNASNLSFRADWSEKCLFKFLTNRDTNLADNNKKCSFSSSSSPECFHFEKELLNSSKGS